MKTHKFVRKALYVDAVRVSEANMEEVAQWCDGVIKQDEEGAFFIEVKVYRPMSDRQTQAFVGDWVLYAGSGFKVYVAKAFDKSFEKVKTLTKAQADEAGIKVPHEPRQKPKGGGKPTPKPPKHRPRPPAVPANPVLSPEIAGKLTEAQGRTETQVPQAEPFVDVDKDLTEPPVEAYEEPATKDEADKLIEELLSTPLPSDQS